MHAQRSRVATGLLALALAFAAPAAADEPDCTWFPDLRCGRHGRLPGFVPPTTFPYLFEDPFVTSGVSVWGLWNWFPDHSAADGGYVNGVAAQLRLALTDRLGFVASKDGWVNLRPDNPLLESEQGWMDLAFGLKYALWVDEEAQFVLTPSLRYEATNGSDNVFAGNGDGLWIPGLSLAKGFGDVHLLANLGMELPVDGNLNSQVLFYDLHLDRVFGRLVPFVELNGLHYTDGGNGELPVKLSNGVVLSLAQVQAALGTGGFEGLDLLNLGSGDVEGNDLVTGALGLRVLLDPLGRSSLGIAYERPLTQRKDLIQQRVTVNLAWEL